MTCESACGDPGFLSANIQWCEASNRRTTAADAPECPTLIARFVGAAATAPPPGDATTSVLSPENNCEKLPKLSERRACALAKTTPSCSRSVTELEGRARLLVTEISQQLDQYGELLERDWSDVSNRALLCAFSRDDLDLYYEGATSNPQILKALQSKASGIQSCQVEWEKWVRNRPVVPGQADSLLDEVARDAEQQLGPLKAQIEGLSASVAKLQAAATTIVGIMDVHLIFCDPAGSGSVAPETKSGEGRSEVTPD